MNALLLLVVCEEEIILPRNGEMYLCNISSEIANKYCGEV